MQILWLHLHGLAGAHPGLFSVLDDFLAGPKFLDKYSTTLSISSSGTSAPRVIIWLTTVVHCSLEALLEVTTFKAWQPLHSCWTIALPLPGGKLCPFAANRSAANMVRIIGQTSYHNLNQQITQEFNTGLAVCIVRSCCGLAPESRPYDSARLQSVPYVAQVPRCF